MEKVVKVSELSTFFEGKKVFITGHSGFKGSWLSLWLVTLGAELFGYALPPEYNNFIYSELFTEKNETLADIRDVKRLEEAILNFEPDYFFHLAAQPLVRKSYDFPLETFDTNIMGTANVLSALRKLKKKCTVVIVTTDKVYENLEQPIFYNEDDRLGGFDPYSASKACAELVTNAFRNSFFNQKTDEQNIKIATARAGNVIGGGDYSVDRIIPDIIRAIESNQSVVIRNPKSIRPWQHVLEPLAGYLILAANLAAQNETSLQGAFNFGPLENGHLTVGRLVEVAIGVYGKGDWKIVSSKSAPHEAETLKLDISKSNEILDWRPKLDAETSVQWTMDWYKQKDADKFTYSNLQIQNYIELW